MSTLTRFTSKTLTSKTRAPKTLTSKTFAAVVILPVAALSLAACSGKSSSSSLTASNGASPSAAGAVVKLADNKVGDILTDASGRTLYLFEADTTSASTCSDACAKVWPPYLTTGAPTAGSGATASLLGTSKRSDGTTEVTYKGHPLYYYVADGGTPGVVKGQ